MTNAIVGEIRAEQDRVRDFSSSARQLIQRSTLVDMTLPMSQDNITEGQLLKKARAAGFDHVSVTVGFKDTGVRGTMDGIAGLSRYVSEREDDFVMVRDFGELRKAKEQGRTAVGIHFQDVAPLEGNLDLLPVYRALGVSHMLLAYNSRSAAADGCAEENDGGLSRFGRSLVTQMRKVGILCDGSHTGYRSTMEALEIYDGPFIFSHSNCRSVFDHYRNIADDQIKACAARGGVIGINGVGRFLNDPFAGAEAMFRHIDHIVSLVGPEHVGIGLDRMWSPDRMYKWLTDNADMWPPNQGAAIRYATYAPHAEVGEVVDLMEARGYNEEAIQGYLGRNFLRVLEEVWC